ncbi:MULTISPECIES: hypothetical protein [Streptomyces violaceusniger group]|nr:MULTISPECIES: hypothetical protein [Streptomyces violaceusniger group]
MTPWVPSARTRQALRGQALARLDRHDLPTADVGYSLATTRTLP